MYIKTYELFSSGCLLIPLKDEINDILIPLIDNKFHISFYDRNKIRINLNSDRKFSDFNFNEIKDELYFLEAFLKENGIIFRRYPKNLFVDIDEYRDIKINNILKS